jgi:hypothetical protein
MDEKTLEALKGSIRKWEKIRDGQMHDEGARNCPLCQLFNNAHNRFKDCEGCPVKQRTGFQFCKNTPYVDIYNNGEFGDLIQAEIDFLVSLLPSDTKGTTNE